MAQQKRSSMICPTCRMVMNYHADKLVAPTTREEFARMDRVLGGVVEEMHTCPGCGGGASRHFE